MRFRRVADYDSLFLRAALGAGFLSAVADRLGLWGPPGSSNVAWGRFDEFLAYTSVLLPNLPRGLILVVGWGVTFLEALLGVALIIGFHTRRAAYLTGSLLLLFALAMSTATGIKTALDASVFAASAGAFLLGRMGRFNWSLDTLLAAKGRFGGAANGASV